jgi:hypothetical protein
MYRLATAVDWAAQAHTEHVDLSCSVPAPSSRQLVVAGGTGIGGRCSAKGRRAAATIVGSCQLHCCAFSCLLQHHSCTYSRRLLYMQTATLAQGEPFRVPSFILAK